MTLSDYPLDLRRRILRSWRPKSIYWIFRHSHGLNRKYLHEVEVRIDLPPEVIERTHDIKGWRVAHAKVADGMLFLRREQPLTNRALRRMFREAVILAYEHGGKFHSWMHKPDLMDWE